MTIRNRNRPDTSALHLIGIDAGLALTRDQLEQLALHTDVIDVRAGEVLCRAGGYPRQFIAVVDGYVDITDRSGPTRIAGPGTRLGGVELLDGDPHDVTVVARSDCRLVVIFGPALATAVGTSRPTPAGSQGPFAAWLRDGAGAKAPTPRPALAG